MLINSINSECLDYWTPSYSMWIYILHFVLIDKSSNYLSSRHYEMGCHQASTVTVLRRVKNRVYKSFGIVFCNAVKSFIFARSKRSRICWTLLIDPASLSFL